MNFLTRYSKFLTIGLANAVVDVVILNLLLLLSPKNTLHIFLCNTVAVICAISNSYFLNKRFTFRDVATGSAKEASRFFVQALLNIALNDAITVLLSTYLIFSKSVPIFVSSNMSKALAMFLSSSMSYLMLRYIVFQPSAREVPNDPHITLKRDVEM